MKKENYVEDLVEGEEVNDRFAIKEKSPPKEYTKGWFFKLVVGDKTFKIQLFYCGVQ